MKANKWNFKTHKYELYELLEGSTLMADLKDVVSCAQCGTKHEYGTMYTSKQIHNAFGFGYSVCQKCHEREYNEQKAKS